MMKRSKKSVITIVLCGTGLFSGWTHAEPYFTIQKAMDFKSNSRVKQLAPALASSDQIHIVLSLKLTDPQALDNFITESRTKGHPNYGRTLSSDEARNNFGPSVNTVGQVVNFLQLHGFSGIKVAGNHLLIEADAPASVVEKTFQTHFAKFRSESGRMGYANTSDVKIPASLAGVVDGVLGLETLTEVRHTPVSFRNAVATVSSQNPKDLPAIYNVGSVPAATSTTIGIITTGNVSNVVSDLNTYTTQNGLPLINSTINYQNASVASQSPVGGFEFQMDSQAIAGISGGVKNMIFYSEASTSFDDMVVTINNAVSDNKAKVISMSLGACETYINYGNTTTIQPNGYIATIDKSLKLAVAQGQTFFVSTGDTGSVAAGCNGTSVLYPASSPYVVAVGGSSLSTDSATNAYVSESGWNNYDPNNPGGGSSSGGDSVLEPMPSWQKKANIPLLAGKTYRALPDIAMQAFSGISIIVNNQSFTGAGGTSLSAPLAAGVWARYLTANNTLGFAPTDIYRVASLSGQPPYHDITTGVEQYGIYSAATGWDYMTGWGTLDISSVYNMISPDSASAVPAMTTPLL